VKVLMMTLGTRGDVQPFVALARGLLAARHEVVLTAPQRFAGFAAHHGAISAGAFAGGPHCEARRRKPTSLLLKPGWILVEKEATMPAHIVLTRSLLASGIIAGAMLPIILGVARATAGVQRVAQWCEPAWDRRWGVGVHGRVRSRRCSPRTLLPRTSARAARWCPVVIAMAAVRFIVSGLVPTDPALAWPRRHSSSQDGSVLMPGGWLTFRPSPARL
jgi:hypothetical protein